LAFSAVFLVRQKTLSGRKNFKTVTGSRRENVLRAFKTTLVPSTVLKSNKQKSRRGCPAALLKVSLSAF
jgi:hypothetical protein